MKESPMLYTTPMVRAILNDRKDITRRLNGLDVINEAPDDFELIGTGITGYTTFRPKDPDAVMPGVYCPYTEGKWHGRIWVRETWMRAPATAFGDLPHTIDPTNPDSAIYYKASYNKSTEVKWKPNIFMPKWACRIILDVTHVRVERLWNISEEEAYREGFEPSFTLGKYKQSPPNSKAAFIDAWNKMHPDQPWRKNPWVWVIQFRRVKP